MAKKRKKPTTDPSALAEAVRQKLAAGRSMAALKDAKLLVKQRAEPPCLELLAAAYTARIEDLREGGMTVEAEQMLEVARERFPDLGSQWQAAAQDIAHARGDLSEALRQWTAEPENREPLSALLRGAIRDPRWVADSQVLADDDALRQAARGAWMAFDQASRGGLDDRGRAALRAVGRRSPLAPWRHLALALDAFHAHDDDRCRDLLEKIDDGDGTAPARDALRAALLDAPPPSAGPARRAVERLVGAAPTALAEARRCAASERGSRVQDAASVAALRALKQLGKRPVMRFLKWLAGGDSLDVLREAGVSAGVMPNWLGSDLVRLLALSADHPVDAAVGWCTWLAHRCDRRMPGGAELALTLEQIESTLEPLAAEVEAMVRVDVLGLWRRGESTTGVVRSFFNTYECDAGDEELLTSWECWQRAFEKIERHTGERRRGRSESFEVYRQIVALDPSPRRFERLLDAAHETDVDVVEEILGRWCELFPRDVEPRMRNALRCEARGAFEQAKGYVEEAERIAPTDPRVRRARMRMTIASLQRHHRDGEAQLCEQDLDELGRLPLARTQDGMLFMTALRTVVECAEPARRRELMGDEADSPRLRAMGSLAEHVLTDGRVAVDAGGRDRSEGLALSAMLSRTAAQLGRPLAWLPDGIGSLTKLRMDELPSTHDELLALCELAAAAGEDRLRLLAAGKGMRDDSSHLSRFLAHRALGLPRNHRRRSRSCAELSAWFAARFGDQETLRMLTLAGFSPTLDLTEARAQVLLQQERAASERAGKRSRARTAPRRDGPRQRMLFEDAASEPREDA